RTLSPVTPGWEAWLGFIGPSWRKTSRAVRDGYHATTDLGPLTSASCKALGMGCPGIRLEWVRLYPRFRMIDCKRLTPDRRTRSRMHLGAKNRRRNHMYPSQSCCALIRAGRKARAVLPL